MSYPPPVDPYESQQYTAPLYDQPGYGQPQYPPPNYGQPVAPPQQRPAESRTVAITLLSAAIAVVFLVGGGVVFYLASTTFSGDKGEKVVQGRSPAPSASVDDGIRIKEPATLNGEPKIKDESLSSLTTDMEKELEGYPGSANAFGAVYGDLGAKKLTAALAGEVDIDDPQRMLDTMFQSFSGENQLTSVSPASTGSLGGVAQCGSTVIGKEDVTICGWADEGSVGMILYFYKTAVDVKGDFPDMRAEIETRD